MKTIIISNRLPVKVERTKTGLKLTQSEGGLATGLGSVYNSENNIWIGWPGIEITDKEEQIYITEKLREKNLIPLFLSEKEVKCFYEGFANEIIWPICHYRPSYSIFEKESWLFYKQVNEKFKKVVEKHINKEDTIWIHDYHLMLLPQLLREKNPNLKIGYFQHIPFPSHEIFKLIPWRKELIEGLLGADLIGFHTAEDVNYFKNSCIKIANKKEENHKIINKNRKVKIADFPMGIDVEIFKKISEERKTKVRAKLIKRHLHQTKIILSIDRLDYSKGIIERIKAIDELLQKYPEYREKITLIQLIVPCRDSVKQYQLLKDEIDRLVGEVNSKYASSYWSPIQYFYNSYPVEKVCALYVVADVCLVTPIRDGMNLVCKEFIACNSSSDSTGVLILSEMAGAAKNMEETFIINPNNIQQMTETLHKALNLPIEKQQDILSKLFAKIQKNNVENWVQNFMRNLQNIKNPEKSKKIDFKIKSEILSTFKKSKKRLFLLDYDGTLVPFTENPEDAFPSEKLLKLLKNLQENPENEVILISGRKHEFLHKWFKDHNLSLIAEHGVWKFDAAQKWKKNISINPKWKNQIRQIIQKAVDKADKSFIEEKSFSLAWHYRAVDEKKVLKIKSELENELLKSKIIKENDLEILRGDCVLEIKSTKINKGTAVQSILTEKKPDFILAIGDDKTDEYMFEKLPDFAFSIKVGNKKTKAKYFLSKQNQVYDFLKYFLLKEEKEISETEFISETII